MSLLLIQLYKWLTGHQNISGSGITIFGLIRAKQSEWSHSYIAGGEASTPFTSWQYEVESVWSHRRILAPDLGHGYSISFSYSHRHFDHYQIRGHGRCHLSSSPNRLYNLLNSAYPPAAAAAFYDSGPPPSTFFLSPRAAATWKSLSGDDTINLWMHLIRGSITRWTNK